MATTTRSTDLRRTGLRLVGAISTVAAVAVLGVSALDPQTAAAAGIAAGYRYTGAQAATNGPAALPRRSDAVAVTYRWTDRGWIRG